MNGIAKPSWSFWGILVLLAVHVPGQAQVATTNSVASTGYVCVQRGPDSKVWQTATVLTNADGSLTTNYPTYTEIATGPVSYTHLDVYKRQACSTEASL